MGLVEIFYGNFIYGGDGGRGGSVKEHAVRRVECSAGRGYEFR